MVASITEERLYGVALSKLTRKEKWFLNAFELSHHFGWLPSQIREERIRDIHMYFAILSGKGEKNIKKTPQINLPNNIKRQLPSGIR